MLSRQVAEKISTQISAQDEKDALFLIFFCWININVSNFVIAKFIGKKEFFVKKTLDRLYRYTIDDLASYIKKLDIYTKLRYNWLFFFNEQFSSLKKS